SEPKFLLVDFSEKDSITTANIDDILSHLYPEATDLAQSVRRLENLVSLHKTLYTQVALYPDYTHELSQLKQHIFHVLGLNLAKVC
ncbi:hypothetical protein ACN4EK_30780, partial [Pantanalinema rosaneae CENA516]|uniref:hypothetical protein n=1 Tax=Pantanalinema rosaneae TaxID=1620701 RepID=UPI003D6DAC83